MSISTICPWFSVFFAWYDLSHPSPFNYQLPRHPPLPFFGHLTPRPLPETIHASFLYQLSYNSPLRFIHSYFNDYHNHRGPFHPRGSQKFPSSLRGGRQPTCCLDERLLTLTLAKLSKDQVKRWGTAWTNQEYRHYKVFPPDTNGLGPLRNFTGDMGRT